ncbi:MAG TPA: hypothetical protein VFZ12_04195 [Dehalococcoidia bacterium]|nr:hypothetical protein [Dehalococcoidia bacterium]
MTTVLTLVLVVLPWILGGLHPSRGDLTWSIRLAFAAGFTSITATVLSTFDIAWLESRAAGGGDATG